MVLRNEVWSLSPNSINCETSLYNTSNCHDVYDTRPQECSACSRISNQLRYDPTTGLVKFMKQAILHFGMHKTGSSSIQDTFALQTPMGSVDYGVIWKPNGSLQIRQGFSRSWFQLDPNNRKRQRARSRLLLRDVFERTHKDKILLSAESICHLDKDSLVDLQRFILTHVNGIRLVGYIREPKGYMESAYQEVVKLQAVNLTGLKAGVDYERRFKHLDVIFGLANVDFWRFQPSEFPNNCVVTDFATKLELPLDKGRIKRSNAGLCQNAVKLLSSFRRYDTRRNYRPIKFLELLSSMEGASFRIGSAFFSSLISESDRTQFESWLAVRTGIEFDEPTFEGNCVESLGDLISVSLETYEWLLEQVRHPQITAREIYSDPSLIVELVDYVERS